MGVLGALLYGNLLMITLCYVYVFRIRKLIGFQLGMNLSMLAGGFMSISTGVILIFEFPLQFTVVTIITTIIGMAVGGLFGAIFDYQTMLMGYANGLMTGIMSPMIGAAANYNLFFIGFIECAFIFSMILFVSSTRYS
ncbi:hypothetical protein [Gracilibacillus xinjiangensis]|uniref:MnxB n=1 Tax=Gracilibacillus xinjiangensis TaxID=1193282 RepID=A0ABV8WU63_9BACI